MYEPTYIVAAPPIMFWPTQHAGNERQQQQQLLQQQQQQKLSNNSKLQAGKSKIKHDIETTTTAYVC